MTETTTNAMQRRSRRRHNLGRGLPLMLSLVLVAGCLWQLRTCRHKTRLDQGLYMSIARQAIDTQIILRRQLFQSAHFSPALTASKLVRNLDTPQKVAQLFFVAPESLVANYADDAVTGAGEPTCQALAERPVGGVIYFQQNLQDAWQTREMLTATADYAREACGIPLLLTVDEEGGTVSRVGGNPGFAIDNVGDMSEVGATGDPDKAQEMAAHIGGYLHQLGFTSDLAPVADVANNPQSPTMVQRSFGSDAELVSRMVAAQVRGFASQHIICCVKHFPGIGGAEGDSHDGAIYSEKSADEMAQEELLPFVAAIEEGVPMVMVGHLSCPTITGNDLPASVSHEVMTDLLRDRLGFGGVVITDSLGMGAIVERYGYDRVCVEAFLAGADALLMPADFDAAYQGMLDAVASGEISEQRLNESVYRVVYMKVANEQR